MDVIKELASDLTGTSGALIKISGKEYKIPPPTIERIAGAAKHLNEMEINTIKDLLLSYENLDEACKALSWFICGNESLSRELAKALPSEVLIGLKTALNQIDIKDFLKLSALARNVRSLIAATR